MRYKRRLRHPAEPAQPGRIRYRAPARRSWVLMLLCLSALATGAIHFWSLPHSRTALVAKANQPPTGLASSATLLTYPYLGETTPTSAIIAWATAGNHAGEVHYGIENMNFVRLADQSLHDSKYWYAVYIEDLQPGTRYQYQLYLDGERVEIEGNLTFTTAPEVTNTRITFAALGDSRAGGPDEFPSQGALDVAAELGRHEVDLVLHAGDIVYAGGICAGDDSGWNQYIRQYFNLYRESMTHTPFYPCIGNHELGGGSCGYEAYTTVNYLPENAPDGATEEFYSFDRGNAHFVSLDMTTANANEAQYELLRLDLQNSDQFWTFVFLHYPAYSSGKHGSHSTVRENLLPIFETYGVDIVFAGHDHHYERTCPIREGQCTTIDAGGVVYYVTGGGGAPLYSASGDWFTASVGSIYEFLKVEIDDCRLQVDTIEVDGAIFDSYAIDRCPSPTPTATPTVTPTATATPHRMALPLLQK